MSKNTQEKAPSKVEYNDAVAESKRYFDGDELAATVWVSKYALKDSFGNIYEKSPLLQTLLSPLLQTLLSAYF